jgi:signal transduction histidine kinase
MNTPSLATILNVDDEETTRAKSRFLANMSHELRTPLNSIIGFTDVVLAQNYGPLNAQQEEFLGYVIESSKHLLDLINNILDLSKIEDGRMELKLDTVRIRDLLSNSLIMVREIAHQQRVHLQEELAGELPVTLTVDERKLKQIVYNLLSNAIKFSPSGGIVTLSASYRIEPETLPPAVWTQLAKNDAATLPLPYLRITVSDTGNGIEQADFERIFNPFEQVDTSETRAFEGSGLGLAITRKLLELHGGAIWAESAGHGKGSAFHCVVPV